MIKGEPFFLDERTNDDCAECAIVSDNKLYYRSFCDFGSLGASITVYDYKIEGDELWLKCTDLINCYEKNQDKYYYNKPDDYVDEYLFSYQIKNGQPKGLSIVLNKDSVLTKRESYAWVNSLYRKIKRHKFNLNIGVKAYMLFKILGKEKAQKHINKIISDMELFKNDMEKMYNKYGVTLARLKGSWNHMEDGYTFSGNISKRTTRKIFNEEDKILEKYNFTDETLSSWCFIMSQLKLLLDGKINPEHNHFVVPDKEMFEAYNKEEQKKLS